MTQSPARVLIVVNDVAFLISHRLPLARAAAGRGYEVHLAAGASDATMTNVDGLPFHAVPLNPTSMSLAMEARAVLAMRRLQATIEPDLIHHVAVKPILYGTLAAQTRPRVAIVNAFSGLGRLFHWKGGALNARRRALVLGYRALTVRAGAFTLFQNEEDRAIFCELGGLRSSATAVVPGVGVNLTKFAQVALPHEGRPVVMLAARLVWEKGVREFVYAADRIRHEGLDARFVVVGPLVPNHPSGVPATWLEEQVRRGTVEYWGPSADMQATLASATLMCVPSYFEGTPKLLMEAAAMGRCRVASDIGGCRTVIDHERDGVLIAPHSGDALANAVRRLLLRPDECRAFGARVQARARRDFSDESLAHRTVDLYEPLLASPSTRSTRYPSIA